MVVASVVLLGVAPLGAGELAAEFRLERRSNYDSVLTWSAADDSARLRLRAGSGTISDECAINFGWLPRGTYDVVAHYTGLAGTIAGYAWVLSDQQCYDGTFRTELLIHSEMSAGAGQNDLWEPNVWTWSDPDDYASFGCIKLSYDDILELERMYEGFGGLGDAVYLRVE